MYLLIIHISDFSEKKTIALLYKVERKNQATISTILIHKILRLSILKLPHTLNWIIWLLIIYIAGLS